MKAAILILFLFSALSIQAQQYYKTTRYDETATGLIVRVESTVTTNFVEREFKVKPDKDKRKEPIKLLIKELRVKDSLLLSAPQKPAVLPKHYDENIEK